MSMSVTHLPGLMLESIVRSLHYPYASAITHCVTSSFRYRRPVSRPGEALQPWWARWCLQTPITASFLAELRVCVGLTLHTGPDHFSSPQHHSQHVVFAGTQRSSVPSLGPDLPSHPWALIFRPIPGPWSSVFLGFSVWNDKAAHWELPVVQTWS